MVACFATAAGMTSLKSSKMHDTATAVDFIIFLGMVNFQWADLALLKRLTETETRRIFVRRTFARLWIVCAIADNEFSDAQLTFGFFLLLICFWLDRNYESLILKNRIMSVDGEFLQGLLLVGNDPRLTLTKPVTTNIMPLFFWVRVSVMLNRLLNSR